MLERKPLRSIAYRLEPLDKCVVRLDRRARTDRPPPTTVVPSGRRRIVSPGATRDKDRPAGLDFMYLI